MNDALVIPHMGIEITEKKKTLLSLLLIPVLVFTLTAYSCNVPQFVNQVNSILSEVGPALQIITALLPLLGGKNIPPSVVTGIANWIPVVQADGTKLAQIVTQYQNDIASSATVQAEIAALIQETENDISSVLPILRVLDPATQQKITAIVTAIGAGILSVENIINAIEGKTTFAAVQGYGTYFCKNGKAFKKMYNSVLHTPTADPVVDAATAQLALK